MELGRGSGGNKSLETHADGSGSSKHSEVSLRAFNGSGSFRSFEKRSDSVDEIGITKGSGTSRRQETGLDVVDESGSNKMLENVDESYRNESSTMQVSSSSLSSSSSSSSYLSSLSLSDSSVVRSQVEAKEFSKSSKHDSSAQPNTKDNESSVSCDSSSRSEEDDTNSPVDSELTFQVSNVSHESPIHGMVSPPMQTMERPEGYDPFRIPSSVFENKSLTPMEWSVASNESLFSLHVGNASFSKDQFLMFGDLSKSGELAKSGEIVMLSPSPDASVLVAEVEGKSFEQQDSVGAKEITEKPIKEEERPSAEHSSAKKVPIQAVPSNSFSHSHPSEGSETSAGTFAFPIKKKCAWPSCYCSNCSCAFCCFRRPSCHCPSCSWAFCNGWNCSKKRKSRHSPSILPGGLKSESMRPENEKLRPESVAAKKTTKSSTACSWFPCLSWCSWSWNCSWRHHCCQCHCSCC